MINQTFHHLQFAAHPRGALRRAQDILRAAPNRASEHQRSDLGRRSPLVHPDVLMGQRFVSRRGTVMCAYLGLLCRQYNQSFGVMIVRFALDISVYGHVRKPTVFHKGGKFRG